ncbi:Ankyrin repeat protein (plasmid) [Legionella adelaidensis]|uniref:Ankyrin repeat protein n=1 Tax=Legionella adelaidensis TaxID=45056 RepID=A0A0W0R0R9_9GAMM|nr:hypothetical protein [Legionella adelaidensis]KTC64645.1 Ankyrin repeat protein [Legionella adelaidensis]VEH86113.1 Ankyrin repeat protein [Legionella adelaidensis]
MPSKHESLRRADNICVNLYKTDGVEPRIPHLNRLRGAFQTYIESLPGDKVPVYTNDLKIIEERFFVYMILMARIATNKYSLTDHYRGKGYRREFHIDIEGWPVSKSDPHYPQWLAFLKEAIAIFKEQNPQLDATSWVGPEQTLTDDLDVPQSDPDLSSDHTSEAPGLDASVDTEREKLVEPLLKSLREMAAYGETLKKDSPYKGEEIVDLSEALQDDLLGYLRNPSSQSKADFVKTFREKLHSKDELMATHRKQWKVIVANVLVALTGFGFIAVGLSLLLTGHGLFNKTKSTGLVEKVDSTLENTKWNAPCCNSVG